MLLLVFSTIPLALYTIWLITLANRDSDLIDSLLREATCEKHQHEDDRKPEGSSSRLRIVFIVLGSAAFVSARVLCVVFDPIGGLLFGLLGGVCGELLWRRRRYRLMSKEVRQMEFNLPMVMERVVMGVSAGLDIVPALKEAALNADDPVSKLLNRAVALSEAGLPVSDSLKTVSCEVACSAVRHSLVHLAVAYQQGGELIRPLRELSDATHSYYQDSVEEVIAQLPVKAVLPLVLTFTGLIICFITVPLMQVGSLTAKVSTSVLEQSAL